MIDIYELEERHKRYKLKKLLPYLVSFVSIVFISSLSYFIFNYIQQDQNIIVSNSSIVETPKQEIAIEKIETNTTSIAELNITTSTDEDNQTELHNEPATQQNKLTLTPSLSFIKDTHSDIPMLYESKTQKQLPREQIVNIPAPIEENIVVEQRNSDVKDEMQDNIKPQTIEITKNEEPEQKGSISIAKKSQTDDLEDVIKRFKTNNSPALSLFIAKKYYRLGDYEKAYDYALITNNLNNSIEESWLIFTKSLVKLGKKDKAVETLQKYINHSHSQSAKQLLEDIKSGKFK